MSIHLIKDIQVQKSSSEKAILELLKKVALRVEPLMKKRNWKVDLLTEFSPRNPSLLGLNEKHGYDKSRTLPGA